MNSHTANNRPRPKYDEEKHIREQRDERADAEQGQVARLAHGHVLLDHDPLRNHRPRVPDGERVGARRQSG